MHSFNENVKVTTGLLPVHAAPTVSVNGASADAQGFSSRAVLFSIGNSGDTLSGSVYLTLSLEASADNSTWSAVAAGDVKAIVDHTAAANLAGASVVINAPTADSRSITMEYGGTLRYLRGVVTATGTHTVGTPIGILNVLANPEIAPVV